MATRKTDELNEEKKSKAVDSKKSTVSEKKSKSEETEKDPIFELAAAAGGRRKSTKSRTSSKPKKEEETTEEFLEKHNKSVARRKEVYDEVVLILTGLACVLMYLSFFDKCGKIGELIYKLIFGMLGGVLPYIFPVALFSLVFYVRKNPDDPLMVRKTTAFSIAQVILASMIHIFSGVCSDTKFFASFKVGFDDKRGGGLLGACLAKPLSYLFGNTAAVIILVALLLVCLILVIGKGLFRAIKNYIDEKNKEAEEAYDPNFGDNAANAAPGSSQVFTLEQIQEENRRRRVTMVDADPPAGPVDLSFYGTNTQPAPAHTKPGFFSRIRKKQPEVVVPTYSAVFTTDESGKVTQSQVTQTSAGNNVPVSGQIPAPNTPFAPDTIGRNSKVSSSGHPFYQIELDTKFRETKDSNGSILKTGYDENINAVPPVSDREAARIAAVSQKLDHRNSNITISGLAQDADSTQQPAKNASDGYNPYDAVESGEAVAPSSEELRRGFRVIRNDDRDNRESQSDNSAAGRTTFAGSSTGAGNANKPAGNADSDTAKDNSSDIAATLTQTAAKPVREYRFPPIDLLHRPAAGRGGMTSDQLKATAAKLQSTLQSFGVNVTVTNISCGPSVTRYELSPEQGVKVSRITNLENDIKLNLAAEDIRIEAPIPGKSAVGIEVPNAEASGVMLRTLIESTDFKTNKGKITFAVGKDIGGNIVLSDIAKMPHLLIAGATGSGKSVCINTMIISLLYKYKPEDLRIIMIDPKVVELSVYNGIPHLLIPVVTDPRKASNALNWAVKEMTDRYERFAQLGVRNLEGYNEKIESSAEPILDSNGNALRKMFQIVIIVDELADLMMVAPGEVEDAICRLAQLARAAGLHLVIATQRPSVDVITGLIKANIPSRIAFAVSSGIDSRTILDQVGAEKLLGKGDMLFFPQGIPKPVRLQGPFVSDEEIQNIVDFLVKHSDTVYDETAVSNIQNGDVATVSEQMKAGDSAPDDGRDEYFAQAGRFIIEKDKASIGMLQRVYKIGFNRAARIMDQLSEAGVVGPEEGTKPRKILMSSEQFEEYLASLRG
ncbi:MAG: DNA translocase FtsK [Lachnospiraceae bacterium]|nr:DNA translocase FtsK [Lachnospiraceae bacterium]